MVISQADAELHGRHGGAQRGLTTTCGSRTPAGWDIGGDLAARGIELPRGSNGGAHRLERFSDRAMISRKVPATPGVDAQMVESHARRSAALSASALWPPRRWRLSRNGMRQCGIIAFGCFGDSTAYQFFWGLVSLSSNGSISLLCITGFLDCRFEFRYEVHRIGLAHEIFCSSAIEGQCSSSSRNTSLVM